MENECLCGIEEHTHSDSCYEKDELICQAQEHIHSLSCYADAEADTETAVLYVKAGWKKKYR